MVKFESVLLGLGLFNLALHGGDVLRNQVKLELHLLVKSTTALGVLKQSLLLVL